MGKGGFVCHLQYWDFYECEANKFSFCMQTENKKIHRQA